MLADRHGKAYSRIFATHHCESTKKMAIHLNNDSHVEQNNSNITPESNKSDNLPSRFIELAVMEVKLVVGGGRLFKSVWPSLIDCLTGQEGHFCN
jgi:hypothetical protein